MWRHPTRDLRHWREQRQGALGGRDCLVRDGNDAGAYEVGRLLRVGCQMQIGEKHLPCSELLALGRQRLFDLHDKLAARIDLIRVRHDFGPHRAVIGVGEAGSQSGVRFDQDVVTAPGQFAHRRRHQTDPIFAILDFLRHANEHFCHSEYPPRSCSRKSEADAQILRIERL
jgi:hypothetical protein